MVTPFLKSEKKSKNSSLMKQVSRELFEFEITHGLIIYDDSSEEYYEEEKREESELSTINFQTKIQHQLRATSQQTA